MQPPTFTSRTRQYGRSSADVLLILCANRRVSIERAQAGRCEPGIWTFFLNESGYNFEASAISTSECRTVSVAMLCMACGAEMILMKVVQADSALLPGFEHHTFACSACHDVERRLVFTRHGREDSTEPMPVHAAPPMVPAAAAQDEPAPGLFRRVVAKLRGS
jgi:hypothetical protein